MLRSTCCNGIVEFYDNYKYNSRGISFLYPGLLRENAVEGLVVFSITTLDSLSVEIVDADLTIPSGSLSSDQELRAKTALRQMLYKHLSEYLPESHYGSNCVTEVRMLYRMKDSPAENRRLEYDLFVEGEEVLLISN